MEKLIKFDIIYFEICSRKDAGTDFQPIYRCRTLIGHAINLLSLQSYRGYKCKLELN